MNSNMDFIKLVRRGRPIAVVKPAPGMDAKAFAKQHQHSEFIKSVVTLRRLGAGINHR